MEDISKDSALGPPVHPLSVTAAGDGARLRIEGEPGRIGGRAWTSDHSLVVDVYQESDIALPVQLSFGTEQGGATPALRAVLGVLPGVTTRLVFPLSALNAETVFLPRTPGRLKATVQGVPTRVEDVSWVEIGVGQVGTDVSLTLTDWRITSDPSPLVPGGPILVDDLGQWTARDWPGKAGNAEAMAHRLQSAAEAAEAAMPASRPDLTQYGGSAQLTFASTGWFRTHHDGKRWWLVDPDGGAFWSAGVDCVIPGETALVTGNEALCAWLPPREGEFAPAWRGPDLFSWATANLIRAFGDGWKEGWTRLTRRALAGIGFNTVGNWSDGDFARGSGLPYVWPLAGFPTTATTIFRDFPDVFAPEYYTNAAAFAQQLTAFQGDKNLVGYFLRNEPLWAFGAFHLAEEMLLQNPARAPHCRRTLADHLRAAYGGNEAAFLTAWGGLVSGFDALAEHRLADRDALTEAARADLGTFSRAMIDAYVRIPSAACRAVDPYHLNLGMRWAWIATDDLLAGSDACDVFSLNTYEFQVDAATVRRAAEASGRPVLIGEFHFGATDRGLPASGLKGVHTQADRGLAYQHFVEQAAALPDIIGAHYFQWNDQPLLGRFDGENWQIGVVDGCHRPYPEFADAVQETHERIYEVAAGQLAPVPAPPQEAGRLGY